MEPSDTEKDERLMQFLGMTEDRVDPEVAMNLLQVVGWDVQAAIEQLYGTGGPGGSRPTSAAAVHPHPERESLLGGGGEPMHDVGGMDAMDLDHQMAAALQGGNADGTGAAGLGPQEGMDEQFALAGNDVTEDDLLAQAMRASQQEEDQRQRQTLREQQEMELQESILMDNMREQQEVVARQQEVEAQQQSQADEDKRVEEHRQQAAALEARRASLPSEPPAGEAGRIAIMLRLPGGRRMPRAFRGTEAVGVMYDFIDVTDNELAGRRYRLVSTHPRKAYEDRAVGIAEAGIQNQFVLVVENID